MIHELKIGEDAVINGVWVRCKDVGGLRGKEICLACALYDADNESKCEGIRCFGCQREDMTDVYFVRIVRHYCFKYEYTKPKKKNKQQN
jgi:hypothetical protein